MKRPDWIVTLNGQALGKLLADEHKQTWMADIPAGLLQPRANELRIEAGEPGRGRDDIRIEDVRVIAGPREQWLGAGRVHVRVVGEGGRPTPARITVTDAEGTLLPVGARSGGDLAVRMGVVYTASGSADFTLPAGAHTIWASRGFAYSEQHEKLTVAKGGDYRLELRLRREVEIPGWKAGDTHLHTFERSRHGDSTAAELSIAVAGEGLDWAVNTEHNRLDNISDLGGLFVAIPGVEFTTQHGHFNLFPWPDGVALPDPRGDWAAVWQGLPEGADVAAVWNHPRDVHSGYRAFDPTHYVELAAESLDGRGFPGDAMEVVNSGAMYSRPLDLVVDWMRQLNRGGRISAVGSSDSHTVTTSLVGQGRTYARIGDEELTAQALAHAFWRGETAVSYGLAAMLERRGETLVAKVYGPSWNRAKRLVVYANGEAIEEIALDGPAEGGLQWEGMIRTSKLRQDAFLAVAAVGGDPAVPFWPINRPYQAATPDYEPMTLGVSAALAWDGDGDGRFRTAREQAEMILESAGSLRGMLAELARYDLAVAAQAGFLLAREGRLEALLGAMNTGTPPALAQRLRAVGEQYAAASSGRER
ncbi:MAG: CehA/McbA family metallohydrolase [Bryobacterales bacterium]